MVSKSESYDRAEVTFSKINGLDQELFKYLQDMSKVIGKGTYLKQLLYKDMLKNKEVK